MKKKYHFETFLLSHDQKRPEKAEVVYKINSIILFK